MTCMLGLRSSWKGQRATKLRPCGRNSRYRLTRSTMLIADRTRSFSSLSIGWDTLPQLRRCHGHRRWDRSWNGRIWGIAERPGLRFVNSLRNKRVHDCNAILALPRMHRNDCTASGRSSTTLGSRFGWNGLVPGHSREPRFARYANPGELRKGVGIVRFADLATTRRGQSPLQERPATAMQQSERGNRGQGMLDEVAETAPSCHPASSHP